jgi:lysophospholipase L1-like esterase
MAAWNSNGGSAGNEAWTVFQNAAAGSIATQENGFVNFRKTNVNSSARWAWIKSTTALADLMPDNAYSIEIKARVQPVGLPDVGSYFEANQLALRLGGKNTAAPIYLRYGDGTSGKGLMSTTSGGTSNAYSVNTSVWHVYRWVLHPDHARYDVYLDEMEDPALENITTVVTGDPNGIYVGAESYHRCNIDIEYVKMGTCAFYGKPKIASLALSEHSQSSDISATITATVYTLRIEDYKRLSISLVDDHDQEVVSGVETAVMGNKAEVRLRIPAGLARGRYFVKAFAPDGEMGGVAIEPRKMEYRITSSAFEGKNLTTFGNSITAAANSWAFQVHQNLRFGNLYNGAVSGAVWYRRTTNGNCAVAHVETYLKAWDEGKILCPDVVIFAYGTNDDSAYRGHPETALGGELLAEVDVFTLAGALRWCMDTIRAKFPNAALYVALPLQSSSIARNEGNLLKMEVIRAICEARNVPFFDCYRQSGITVENHGIWLSDGLHPNEAGKALMANYIMDQLEASALASGLSVVAGEKSAKAPVSISSRVLHAGDRLVISVADGASPLSEIELYAANGKRVFRKSVSTSSHTLSAPDFGIYFLSVRLKNKTRNVFKVFVL